MSGYNCCFSACIQISKEAGKVVWYSHLFKKFSTVCYDLTVKDFSKDNEAEVDAFLEFSCLFYDPTELAIQSLVPLPFLNGWFMSMYDKNHYNIVK